MTNMTPDPNQPPVIPAPQYQYPTAQFAPILPPKKHTVRNVLLIIVAGLVALCGVGTIVAAASSGNKPASHAAVVLPSSTAQHIQPGQQDPGIAPAASGNVQVVPVSPVPAKTQAAPKPTTQAPPPPAAPKLTVSQEQAVASAKDYLNVSHFSRKGLIDQLKFEGFSDADATYGADHAGADWMAQAVGAAQDYLRVSHFSHSGMVEQLKFDGFTDAEAEHGASAVGL